MTNPDPLDSLRRRTQEVLEKAVGEGGLDLGEFSELAGLVWSTDDPKQLERLILESHVGSELSPFGEPPAPGEASGTAVAVLGDHKRTGSWVVPEHLTVVSVMGVSPWICVKPRLRLERSLFMPPWFSAT